MSETIKSFNVNLNKQVFGEQALETALCKFTYHWDFETKKGRAVLNTINGSAIDITLGSAGIWNKMYFVTDISPTKFSVNSKNDGGNAPIEITIFRVIIHMNEKGEDGQASIMFGETGGSLLESAGFARGSH